LLFINCEVIKKVVLPTWHLWLSHRNPTAQNANHKRHWKKEEEERIPKNLVVKQNQRKNRTSSPWKENQRQKKMALQWMILTYLVAAEAVIAVLLTLPSPKLLKYRLVSLISLVLQPALFVVPFAGFQLLGLFFSSFIFTPIVLFRALEILGLILFLL
jgi:hypothetical protein